MKFIFAVKHNDGDFEFREIGAEARLKTFKQGFIDGFRSLGYHIHPGFAGKTIMVKGEDRWTLIICSEKEWKNI